MTSSRHKIVIIGGGSAGIPVAARLLKKGYSEVAVVQPSDKHYYQPRWTLVGGGCAKASTSERSEASVMPKGATWICQAATAFRPDENIVVLGDGSEVEYEVLVVAPGIQLDWDRTEGLPGALGVDGVSSDYRFDLAPKTWDFVRGLRSGTAVFTMPSGPIKCAGAPQKIAYLASDYWRKEGVLNNIDVHLVLPTPRTFGIPEIADELDKVASGYGITLHFQSEMTAVDTTSRSITVTSLDGASSTTLDYDVLHAVPHQSAPDWIKSSPLATSEPTGYVEVDKHTMQHVRYPNIFSLGDASSTPNSKTGAAIRKQAPVVVANIEAYLTGQPLSAEYGGYASCPLTTARNKMLLAEFDYSMQRTPSFPVINLVKPRRDMWFLKKYGLPFLYWNLMLTGRA